jgi:hypothetical protein
VHPISINCSYHSAYERPFKEPFSTIFNLEETEALTRASFAENYQQAQQAGLPCYLVVVVELNDPEEPESIYKCYDAVELNSYHEKCQDGNIKFTCPLTRLPIEKTHYFALDCFKVVQNEMIPIDASSLREVRYIYPKRYDCDGGNESDFIEALNYSAILEGGEKRAIVHQCQHNVFLECRKAFEEANAAFEELAKVIRSYRESTDISGCNRRGQSYSMLQKSCNHFNHIKEELRLELEKWRYAYNCSQG